MKLPLRSGQSGSSKTEMDEQIQEAVTDAIKESNDKTVEIRPANQSKGRGKALAALVVGAVVAAGYWLRRSRKPTKKLEQTASKTADQTKKVTEQAAGTIQQVGEKAAQSVEKESQKAGEQVKRTSETAAEKTQQAGKEVAESVEQGSQKASEQVERTGEEAAEKTEQAAEKADGSGGSSSGS